MNVTIKHQGVNVTGFCIRYERIHKICTGIGTLNIEFADSINRTFSPWQSIDIYENGDFKVRYYVSSVEHAISRGTYVLDCQDNSKRIVDYFIPDTYLIDYPSYTGYWIQFFLNEAGVDCEFTVNPTGALLSNYTQLGLTTVYEQVTTLLQMSGWYMYFDGNGKAIIGSLTTDLAEDRASVGKTDILNISVESNDKMLRNKALVFGAYDAYTGTNAKASVIVHTPWNYDHRDIRTVVISNSNIPDSDTAYGMANQIVKEFARITVEKHITLWGARDFNLGTALRVTSNVWKGRGLVTTFGVSMSKQGLVTDVVLDERCPRLFGFFDFGDYVYVATMGSGIWKKHLKFDPTWYDFSSGLTCMEITDMHIKDGLFGAVSSSGDPFYAIDSTPWHKITLSGLESSMEDIVSSGVSYTPAVFSGLYSRATIIDKIENTVKFGIDNVPMLNTGDYFIDGAAVGSGITTSGYRSWIVEYDVLGGDLQGTPYPVSLSGNYEFRVVDLENDGLHDYVSVATPGSEGPVTTGTDHNFGHHYTQPFASSKDYNAFSIYPDTASIAEINSGYRGDADFSSLRVQNKNSLIAIDDQISGYSFTITVGADKVARKNKYERTFNGLTWDVTRTQTTSSALGSLNTVIGIYPDLGADTYRVFNYKLIGATPGSTTSVEFYYADWNALSNSWGTNTLIQSITMPGVSTGYDVRNFVWDSVVSGNNIKFLYALVRSQANSFSFTDASYLYIGVITVQMSIPGTPLATDNTLLEYITDNIGSDYYYFAIQSDPDSSIPLAVDPTSIYLNFHIFQDGSGIKILGRAETFRNDTNTADDQFGTKEILFSGNDTVVQYNEIYTDVQTQNPYTGIRRFQRLYLGNNSQLTATTSFISGQDTIATGNSFAFNGTTFYTYSSPGTSTPPKYLNPANIYPIFANNVNQYIVKDDSVFPYVWYVYSADSFSQTDTISPLNANTDTWGFSSMGIGGFGESVYAYLSDWLLGEDFLVPYNFSSFDVTKKVTPSQVPSLSRPTLNFGNFFIQDANYTIAQPVSDVLYLDLGNPDWQAATYLVLQRDGYNFTVIEEEAYPIRVDISNNSPLLTVGSGDATFVSNYIYDSELTVIEPVPSGTQQVNDYRYTFMEPILGSGGVSATILYVYGSGIFGSDALTYSGGFTQMFDVPSGIGTKIETSNFGADGQYIFITVSGITYSGMSQGFYQMNPGEFSFTDFNNGFPQSRATIIRLDDAL